MSWFAKNYEKAALGGAAVLALGLAYMGWSKFAGVEADFPALAPGQGKSDPAVKGAELVSQSIASMKRDLRWTQAEIGEAKRPVDLFTGIPLFVSSTETEKAIDLMGEGQPVHPPIPNVWWIENRLDPGFADSPSRDPDSDGFSNLEEYNAKTDPNNAKDVPSLIAKLMYVRDESLGWVIRPGYGDGEKFPFKYADTKKGTNQTGAANMIAPGEMFFAAGVMQDRFKLLGSEIRKVKNPRTQAETDVTMVRIEDQRPNKKGTIYEFPSPLADDARQNEFLKYDRTAVLSLEALGNNGKEFKVEENTTFGLPFDSPKKNYRVKEVTPNSVIIEDVEGKAKPVTINKGAVAGKTEE